MGKIVAIGGGDMGNHETSAIDQEILRLTGKRRPKALLIPTATYDSVDTWETFQRIYGKELGCETDVLWLLDRDPKFEVLEELILSSDLVYVSGGNTLKMMRRWRKLGVDRVLNEAYTRGIVLSGVSAGAICWFNDGHSDSMHSYNPQNWKYIRVKGMGIIDALACPHFNAATDGIKREQDFRQMVQARGGMGVGIDNNCALEFIDDTFRVITSSPGVGAYKIYKDHQQVVVKQIPQKSDFTPVSTLLSS